MSNNDSNTATIEMPEDMATHESQPDLMTNQATEAATRTEINDRHQSADLHQYVICRVAGVNYGFDVEKVAKIIRVPETTAVPQTPEAFVGMADLHKRIVPILDLRCLLKQPKADCGETSRVIIADIGYPVGLVVDSISEMLDVEADQIEREAWMNSLVPETHLEGVLKDEKGGGTTLLLNVVKLIDPELSAALEQATENRSGFTESENDRDETLAAETDTKELLTFFMDGEGYAFDIVEVEQIARVPKTVTSVPANSNHLLGIMDLHGQVIPLVSLRRMFRFADAVTEESNRVLVINLASSSGSARKIGVLVDQVGEVLHIPTSTLEQGLNLSSEEKMAQGVTTVLPLDEGSRKLAIMSVEKLFGHTSGKTVKDAQAGNEQNAGSKEYPTGTAKHTSDDVQLVVFDLDGQEHAVVTDFLQEIARVPDQIALLPNANGRVEGMGTLRGTAVPVFDMRTLTHMDAMEKHEKQRMLVFQLDATWCAFIIDRVVEVMQTTAGRIEDITALSGLENGGTARVVNLHETNRTIPLLDVHALLGKQG